MKIYFLLGIFIVACAGQEEQLAGDQTMPMDKTPPDTKSSIEPEGATPIDTNDAPEGKAEGQPDQSVEYRQLDQDEVKALLMKIIVENVDKNNDGFVVAEELKEWLKVLQEKVIQDNVRRQWEYYHPGTAEANAWDQYYPQAKEVVTWDRYMNMTYPEEAFKEDTPDTPEMKEMKDMIRRAERRWKNADVDGDGNLSREEFRDYIHPEESQRAGDVVVQEAMEDMDLDKNGFVSLEEYMIHLKKVSPPEEKDSLSWAAAQQGHFHAYLDKDKDGSLNPEEMKEWVVPTYDRSEAEAWRLISLADADQDARLDENEILTYHEYFLTLLPPEYWVQDDQGDSSKHDEF